MHLQLFHFQTPSESYLSSFSGYISDTFHILPSLSQYVYFLSNFRVYLSWLPIKWESSNVIPYHLSGCTLLSTIPSNTCCIYIVSPILLFMPYLWSSPIFDIPQSMCILNYCYWEKGIEHIDIHWVVLITYLSCTHLLLYLLRL